MIKRALDLAASAVGLCLFSPVLIITLFLIWIYDFHNPFYQPMRVGKGMKTFKMYKLRSMVVNADHNGVTSTSGNDKRITPIGRYIRRYKLDEVAQLINVFKGDMSLVGPRPQVVDHVLNEYTAFEKRLLRVKPGITDISSIVFSDEGDILKNSVDPDKDYNSLIRPWKSKLGVIYIENKSFSLDLKLIVLTLVSIVNKQVALNGLTKLLKKMKADEELIDVCRRTKSLVATTLPF